MLTKYTLDLNDEDLTKQSIELRKRFAGRKLNENIQNGVINDRILIKMKDMNRHERIEHGKEVHHIMKTIQDNRTTIVRSEQQLIIQNKLSSLKNDIARSTRLNKSKVNTLVDLENRIIKLRQNLNEPQPLPNVEHVMIDQLTNNNKSNHKIQELFQQCNICNRKVLNDFYQQHYNACVKMNGSSTTTTTSSGNNTHDIPIYDVDINLKTSLTTFQPQPPRNCNLCNKGYRYISFTWESPVFDGGLPITNYEINYKTYTVTLDPHTKMKIVKVKEQPIISTSQWFYKNPICHNGFKLTGLDAGQSYVDFRIRSVNLRGVSDWIDLIPADGPNIITTLPPVAPWEPLFVHISKVTSTCIYLDWEPPLFDGGCEIVQYEIKYTVHHKTITSTNRLHVTPKEYTLKTSDTSTKFVIRNLPSSTKVEGITITAMNKAEMKGKKAQVTWGEQVNITQPCSRFYQIQEEIQRVMNHQGEFIDSDFYTGVAQKLYKKDYLEKLKADILNYSPTEEENEEANEWNKILTIQLEKKKIEELTELALAGGGIDSDDDHDEKNIMEVQGQGQGHGQGEGKDKKNFNFSYKIRKKHYEYKINKIIQTIENYEKEQVIIDMNRVEYTNQLSYKQKRLIEIQAEIDRVINYDGLEIVSNVLQGVEMTYLITILKQLLNTTWTTLLNEISQLKYQIIQGEKKKENIQKLLKNLYSEKQNKIAKLNNFLKEYEKQQRIITNLVSGGSGGMSRYNLLYSYYQKLKKYQQYSKNIKKNIQYAFNTCSRRFLKSAFEKWLTGKFSQEDDDGGTSGGGNRSVGVGSVLLNNARKLREEIQSTLRQELASTNQISKNLSLITLSKKQYQQFMKSDYHTKMEEGMSSLHMVLDGGMKFLYEGDGYTILNKYNLAQSCYEAQIILLNSYKHTSSTSGTSRGGASTSTSSPNGVNIKYLAICYGRLGKLYLRQERYDRSIIEYDRQYSLGKEINDVIEMSDSYYGIGTCYYYLLEYYQSITYLNKAYNIYELIGNYSKACGCLKLLQKCYKNLNKNDLVTIYSQKIHAMENDLNNKIINIYEKINNMTNKLLLNSAVFEFEVKMERSSYRILQLKEELKELEKNLIIEENINLKNQQKICFNIENLLEAIQQELNLCQTVDGTEMMSYLVHDNPQMVNIEEIKTRLHKRRLDILEQYKIEKNNELNIEIRINNLNHNITTHNTEIEIEYGELMKKIKNNRPFRIITFNPANSAGDEVTGTATGGVENFICSESNNIHVIDYHNGELLHVFPGDIRSRLGDKKGHIGVITCLAYDMNRIYSGSTDEMIMIWDYMTRERVMVLTGHEGTIVSLAVHSFMLMSGGADATIRLWDKNNGRELRIIHGHSESVLSIDLGLTWMVTASADEEVRVWEIKEKSRYTIKVDTKFRLQGHNCAVTIAKYGKLEVVSGDKKGDIIVWWVETGAIVQHIKGVHQGRVNCLQFDATRIVSGGADNNVCIIDIGTGRILQTLRGHTNQIMCLAFDTERIVSASRDSTLRYWKWGDKRYQPADKYHIMAPTDSLPLIAKTYELDLNLLMKWNGIRDIKDCYSGMRLIVRKANPDQLTKAELAEFDKQRRRLNGIQQTNKKIQQLQLEKGNLYQQHSRVYKIATDIDPYSLGNRMFKQEKINGELFPEKSDLYTDYQSLGSRIRANTGKPHIDHSNGGGSKNMKFMITKGNENEWGDISDELGIAILETFIEFQAYELIIEEKKKLRDSMSVLGRINMSNEQKAMNTKILLGAGSKSMKKPGKREKIEQALAYWSEPIPEEILTNEEKKKKEEEGGGGVIEDPEILKERREKKRQERRERMEKKLEERKVSGEINEGDGGLKGNHERSNSADDAAAEGHSASDDEEDEDDNDYIFNRKKYRQQSAEQTEQQQQVDDLLSNSEADESVGDEEDYGLLMNKRKLSNSTLASNNSKRSAEHGVDEAINALTMADDDGDTKGDGDGDDKKSKGGSSLTASRRGSNLSNMTPTTTITTPHENTQRNKPRSSVSSGSDSNSTSKHQPSLAGSSINVDDEDADLLSLLKTEATTNKLGKIDLDNDDGDY